MFLLSVFALSVLDELNFKSMFSFTGQVADFYFQNYTPSSFIICSYL